MTFWDNESAKSCAQARPFLTHTHNAYIYIYIYIIWNYMRGVWSSWDRAMHKNTLILKADSTILWPTHQALMRLMKRETSKMVDQAIGATRLGDQVYTPHWFQIELSVDTNFDDVFVVSPTVEPVREQSLSTRGNSGVASGVAIQDVNALTPTQKTLKLHRRWCTFCQYFNPTHIVNRILNDNPFFPNRRLYLVPRRPPSRRL